jgi:hypothetical protein
MSRNTRRRSDRQGATVVLYHASPRRNYPSISCQGLLTAMSQGALKAVWLVEEGRVHWACLHAVRRHGGRIEDVLVFKVEVPRGWLRGHGGAVAGLYRCVNDVAPQRFRKVSGFGELSASPVRARVKVVA